MKVVIIAGSERDKSHVDAIVDKLAMKGRGDTHVYYCSAHKDPRRLLNILDEYGANQSIIFVTVAGLSNALSGMVAANTNHPVVACPPFATTADYLVDIHSTLRMPSGTPVLTVLGTENCAEAVWRLTKLAT